MFLFLLGFTLPCLAIIICYSAIFYRVRSSRQAVVFFQTALCIIFNTEGWNIDPSFISKKPGSDADALERRPPADENNVDHLCRLPRHVPARGGEQRAGKQVALSHPPPGRLHPLLDICGHQPSCLLPVAPSI